MTSSHSTPKSLLAGVFLVVMTAVVYAPVVRCGFIWDDDVYVTQNTMLRTTDGLVRMWFEPGATVQYYPLTFTTFWVEYRLFGDRAAVYHVVNVALHATAVVLLWVLLRFLSVPGAWLAAAIFAIHPVHVESVAWITERKNVLTACFALSAILTYCEACRNTAAIRMDRRSQWLYGLSLFLFACAMFSKTASCPLPLVMMILLWWKQGRIQVRGLLRLVPFFVVAGGLGLVTVWVEMQHVGAQGTDWPLTFVERGLVAGRAVWFYATKLILPVDIAFVYPRWDVDVRAAGQWLFPLGLVILVAALWRFRLRIGRGPLAAVLIFILMLAPALGFINIYFMRYSFVSDHFAYLANIAMIALFSALLTTGLDRLKDRLQASFRMPSAKTEPLLRFASSTVILAALGTLTWKQIPIYRDAETLWRDALAKNPSAWLAYNNLGDLLQMRGNLVEAEHLYRLGIQHKSKNVDAMNNLGTILDAKGDVEGARRLFEEVLQADPRNVLAHNNLGYLLGRHGQYDAAARHLAESIRLKPDFAVSRSNLANVYLLQKRYQEAALEYLQALEHDPAMSKAYPSLASALRQITDYTALQRRPNWPGISNDLAWAFATSPDANVRDGAAAVRLAESACAVTEGRNAYYLDTLAAAYAEAGRFADAVDIAKKALAVAAAGSQDRVLVEGMQQRLRLYEAGHSYREPR